MHDVEPTSPATLLDLIPDMPIIDLTGESNDEEEPLGAMVIDLTGE
jgi:hypothetical protein